VPRKVTSPDPARLMLSCESQVDVLASDAEPTRNSDHGKPDCLKFSDPWERFPPLPFLYRYLQWLRGFRFYPSMICHQLGTF
jgi:hypothetical protein